jgi:tripartite-type tricarboxylate transporter receptor subunit TctC
MSFPGSNPGAPASQPRSPFLALRNAFNDAMNDSTFREEAQRAKLEITPVRGEAIQKEIADIYATSSDVVAAAKQITKPQ